MSAQENKQVVTDWIQAFNDNDVDAITGALSDDVTWFLPGDLPTSGLYEGRAAVVDDFLAAGLPLFEPGTFKLEVINMLAEGDQVALEWKARAKAANGNNYDNIYALFITVRDGKIHGVREHTDSLYASKTLF